MTGYLVECLPHIIKELSEVLAVFLMAAPIGGARVFSVEIDTVELGPRHKSHGISNRLRTF